MDARGVQQRGAEDKMRGCGGTVPRRERGEEREEVLVGFVVWSGRKSCEGDEALGMGGLLLDASSNLRRNSAQISATFGCGSDRSAQIL